MRLVRILFLTVCFAWPFSLLWAQSPQLLEDAQVEQRVIELLGQLTPQEKFDQIVDFSDSSTGPGSPHVDYREQIAKCRAGSLENVRGAAEKNALQSLAIEKSRLYIPLLFSFDMIHRFQTIFPMPLTMASTWDPSLLERASRNAAKAATREGIRWTFSPMLDIARDARWGRIVEGAVGELYLVFAMAFACVRRYQGDRLGDRQSMRSCMKHFVGYRPPAPEACNPWVPDLNAQLMAVT